MYNFWFLLSYDEGVQHLGEGQSQVTADQISCLGLLFSVRYDVTMQVLAIFSSGPDQLPYLIQYQRLIPKHGKV